MRYDRTFFKIQGIQNKVLGITFSAYNTLLAAQDDTQHTNKTTIGITTGIINNELNI
jgi:hypothetical protein